MRGGADMKKKAINKCPICGGEVVIYAVARVGVVIGEDGSTELTTNAREVLDDVLGQVHTSRAVCIDCECGELRVKRLPNGDFEVSVRS